MCSRSCLDERCEHDLERVLRTLCCIILPHLENPLDVCVNKAFTDHIFAFMRITFPPLIRGKCKHFAFISRERAVLKLRCELFVRALVAAINDGALSPLKYLQVQVEVENVLLLRLLRHLGGDAFPRLETLDFAFNSLGDSDDIGVSLLCSSLATACGSGALPQLKELWLQGNQIGNEGMIAFAAAIGSGAMAKLTILYLGNNEIGDAGMQAFATACGNGAIPQLKELSLFSNRIGNAGMQAFATACGSGAIPQLKYLHIGDNEIGDDGMAAFASAIVSGAMANLTTLYLYTNKIEDAGMAAFSTALGSGTIPQLKQLYLNGNKIGNDGMQAFAGACGSGALPKLVTLYVAGNPASEASIKAATDAIKNRSK